VKKANRKRKRGLDGTVFPAKGFQGGRGGVKVNITKNFDSRGLLSKKDWGGKPERKKKGRTGRRPPNGNLVWKSEKKKRKRAVFRGNIPPGGEGVKKGYGSPKRPGTFLWGGKKEQGYGPS